MTDKACMPSAPNDEGGEPKCDKCGIELMTAMVAIFCPRNKDCEFWTPELETFMAMFKEGP